MDLSKMLMLMDVRKMPVLRAAPKPRYRWARIGPAWGWIHTDDLGRASKPGAVVRFMPPLQWI